ncbi:hypothetical protein LTR50_007326 [Elasticomyces elasticus]|nr:hypothetical protein LTR50_007326 [Elasticomyces elasticus]
MKNQPSNGNSYKLTIVNEKRLAQEARRKQLSYCAATHLVALVTVAEDVEVYRIGGQCAFRVKRKDPSLTVSCFCWKFDGSILAVAWSDSSVDTISGESGKPLRIGIATTFSTAQAMVGVEEPTAVTYIGWGVNLVKVDTMRKTTRELLPTQGATPNSPALVEETTESWLADSIAAGLSKNSVMASLTKSPEAHVANSIASLPEQLALTDVESVLPKLSPIPLHPSAPIVSGDATPEIFTSQTMMDKIFHSWHLADHNVIDMLFVGYSTGSVRVVMNDTLDVGQFGIGNDHGILPHMAVMHASHPSTSIHAVLWSDQPVRNRVQVAPSEKQNPALQSSPQTHALCLSFTDIPLGRSSGLQLHLIASKTTQMENIVRYIVGTIRCMVCDYSTGTILPSRFIENINETLAENEQGTLDLNLLHLALTGDCSAVFHEWLKVDLGERGYKRWDSHVNHMYEHLTKHTHNNLLPALERATIVVSRLRGLALFHDANESFSVEASVFDDILEVIDGIRFLAYQVLIVAGEEHRQFRAFSRWLRLQIDLVSANTNLATEENMERDAAIDYEKVTTYIKGPLMQSRLQPLLKVTDDYEQLLSRHCALPPSLADVKAAISRHRQGLEADPLRLSLPISGLAKGCLQFRCNKATVNLYAVQQHINSPQAEPVGLTATLHIRLPKGSSRQSAVKDLKFVDDDVLLALFDIDGELCRHVFPGDL